MKNNLTLVKPWDFCNLMTRLSQELNIDEDLLKYDRNTVLNAEGEVLELYYKDVKIVEFMYVVYPESDRMRFNGGQFQNLLILCQYYLKEKNLI